MNQAITPAKPSTESTAKIVYILYLISIFIGLTAIIGVVMAYINKNDAPAWLQSHYQFQIRTFWIGLLYVVVGSILTYVLIGFLILFFWLIWIVIRCVKGLKRLDQREAIPDPTSWLF